MKKTSRAALPALAIVALLVAWEALVRILKIPSYVLPAPRRCFRRCGRTGRRLCSIPPSR